MMLAMDGLQPSQRKMRINLRGGNVSVTQQKLHTAQVGAVLHHMGGATVAQPVRAGIHICRLHQMPDPLARQWHATD